MAPSELDSHGRMYTLWKARPVLSRNAWDQFACDSVPLRVERNGPIYLQWLLPPFHAYIVCRYSVR